MTIQEYLNKIEALRQEKTTIAFQENVDLEFCVQKIQQSSPDASFIIDDLFQEISEIIFINKDVVKYFANHLGLLFLEEQESGNVCFANSEEVRAEYKQSFKLIDVLDYIYAFGHSTAFKESQKVIVPSEKDLFWKLVKIGLSLRNDKI
ncbi:hypothetical protein [Flavobacterium chungangensis]|uniref:Uncharacterized protein n=1 Tax=Flavobacterium chungangensis TaxID=2708132 RepID=A0ABV8ZDQ4_9FLAO